MIFPDASGDMSVDKNSGTYPDANLPIQRGKQGTFYLSNKNLYETSQIHKINIFKYIVYRNLMGALSLVSHNRLYERGSFSDRGRGFLY